MFSGIAPLASLFELWLRDEGAALMGCGMQQNWRHHVEHPTAGVQPQLMVNWRTVAKGLPGGRTVRRHEPDSDIGAPDRFTLDGTVCNSRQTSPEKIQCRGKALDVYPVATAWHSFVWCAVCREVEARFAEDHHIHLVMSQEPFSEKTFSMLELYTNLFRGVEGGMDDPDQWRNFANTLHGASHEKLPESSQCTICVEGRRNLRQDKRRQVELDWDFKAICLLWDTVVATVHQYGTSWSAWRAVRSTATVSAVPSLPPKLTMEDVPLEQVIELPGGIFAWGSYRSAPGKQSREEGWSEINEYWRDDRQRRINIIAEADARKNQRPQNEPGEKLILRIGEQAKCYTGRVWRTNISWRFQEDGTGIVVSTEMNPYVSLQKSYPQCEARLYRAMYAEHLKQKQAITKAAKKKAAQADVPKTTSDMTVKCTTPKGKLVLGCLSWKVCMLLAMTYLKIFIDVEKYVKLFKM